MAVYTHVTTEILEDFLGRFDVGILDHADGITAGVENTNYKVTTSQGVFILTLYERRVEAADLPFFLSLMAHMARCGLPSARPVADRTGATLHTLAERPAALIEFLPGQCLDWPDEAACHEMGIMLARVHDAGATFEGNRTNPLSLGGWKSLADACGANTDRCAPDLAALITDELAFLGQNWPNETAPDLPRGVVHTDFFPDNVLFNEGGGISGLIDFYFSCTDYFVFDLAVCLTAWCFDAGHRPLPGNAAAFLAGYRSRYHQSPRETAILPVMLRGSALRFLLTRTYDWLNQVPGAVVKVKDPLEYRTKLLYFRTEAEAFLGL